MTGDTSKKQKSGSERRAIQNREAQRAFRQRKLQRIKDLESQVASLSAGTSGSVSPLKATHCDAPTNSNAELSRLRQLVSELQTEAVRLRSMCNSFKTIIKNTGINNTMTHSAKTSTTVITSNTISNCARINTNRTDTIHPQQMTNTGTMIASFH
ncbi:hypothetical protein BJ741DRAFT_576146 [Chytriomyces cf. hyalinus JEL632]|nr:hypothetical protein BJ741DRAFT_576146 [Chytriomyces cf. hyalinus JEL632]